MAAHAPEAHADRPRVSLWLVAVIALAAAFVALGGWVLVDRYTGPAHDATTLLDDWYAAASSNDGEAAARLWADNGVLWMNGDEIVGAPAIAGDITVTQGLRIERTAPVTVEGDFATTFVEFTAEGIGVREEPVVDVFQLEGEKILRQWSFVLGETPPFDDTVEP